MTHPLLTTDRPDPALGYGPSGLASLFASLGASLGVDLPGVPVRELPPVHGVVSVLLDGLGWTGLERYAGHAPFLRSLLHDPERSAPAVCGFPSTTAVSLATHATGLPPAVHGHVGYAVRDPRTSTVFNHLSWKEGPDPLTWQQQPTLFGRLADAGVRVVRVGQKKFATSALTRAAQRGGTYQPADGLQNWTAAGLDLARRASRSEPTAAYLYWPVLDQIGHAQGPGAVDWTSALEQVDAALRELVEGLPSGVHFSLTADHGMLGIDPAGALRTDEPEHAHLVQGVAAVAGDPRCRFLYLPRADESPEGRQGEPDAGQLDELLAAWREAAGPAAAVVSRTEAVESGWFGEGISTENLSRIGDMLVVALDAEFLAFVPGPDSTGQMSLKGWHGGLHREELLVPDVLVPAR
ncbi:alkaline phosphatase family protein [Kytococcus sp. Marseille-QA3725]